MTLQEDLQQAQQLMIVGNYDELFIFASQKLSEDAYDTPDARHAFRFYFTYAQVWKCCEKFQYREAIDKLISMKNIYNEQHQKSEIKYAIGYLETLQLSLGSTSELVRSISIFERDQNALEKILERLNLKLDQRKSDDLPSHDNEKNTLQRKINQIKYAIHFIQTKRPKLKNESPVNYYQHIYQSYSDAASISNLWLFNFQYNWLQYCLGFMAFKIAAEYDPAKSSSRQGSQANANANKNYETCASHFVKVQANGSEYANEVPATLASVYNHLGRYDEAQDELNKVLRPSAGADYPLLQKLRASYYQACLYARTNRLAEARAQCLTILESYHNLNSLTLGERQILAKLNALDKSLSQELGMENFESQQKKLDQAKKEFKQRLLKAEDCFSKRDYLNAKQLYEECLADPLCDQPTQLRLYKTLVEVYGWLSGLLEKEDEEDRRSAVGLSSSQFRDWMQKIIRYYKLISQQDPNYIRTRMSLVYLAYYYYGDMFKALKICNTMIALSSDPSNPFDEPSLEAKLLVSYHKSRFLERAGDYPQALEAIEQIIQSYPPDSQGFSNKSKKILRKAHLQAINLNLILNQATKETLKLYPASPAFNKIENKNHPFNSYQTLATIQFYRGNFIEATMYCNLSQWTNNSMLAACCVARNQPEGALHYFNRYIEESDKRNNSHYLVPPPYLMAFLGHPAITLEQRMAILNTEVAKTETRLAEYQESSRFDTVDYTNESSAAEPSSSSAPVPEAEAIFPYVSPSKERMLHEELALARINRAVLYADQDDDKEKAIEDLMRVVSEPLVSLKYRLFSALQLHDLYQPQDIFHLVRQFADKEDKTAEEICIFSLALLALDEKDLAFFKKAPFSVEAINTKCLPPYLSHYCLKLQENCPSYLNLQDEITRRINRVADFGAMGSRVSVSHYATFKCPADNIAYKDFTFKL